MIDLSFLKNSLIVSIAILPARLKGKPYAPVLIIGNAIDAITEFSKANGGTISIFSKDVLSNNGTVLEIIIGNDGPSFEDEDLASMFELFFTKGKKGGTGIGLASTQKIVSLHNGSVKARNRLNKNGDIDGVEFVILIPASGEIEKIN